MCSHIAVANDAELDRAVWLQLGNADKHETSAAEIPIDHDVGESSADISSAERRIGQHPGRSNDAHMPAVLDDKQPAVDGRSERGHWSEAGRTQLTDPQLQRQ